jgi:hypothetical protein
MWYSKHLRLVRRARQVAKTRQQQLLALDLEGIVALTLHTVTDTLTIPIERSDGAQVVDTLREALRDRRRLLKAEAHQLRQNWQESDGLRVRQSVSDRDGPPTGEAPPH